MGFNGGIMHIHAYANLHCITIRSNSELDPSEPFSLVICLSLYFMFSSCFIFKLTATYSGFQNCPNVCVFPKDLNIVAQWINNFLKVLLYLTLYYLDFSFQFKLCNLDQNSLFNELNKKSYYWGSFGTLSILYYCMNNI